MSSGARVSLLMISIPRGNDLILVYLWCGGVTPYYIGQSQDRRICLKYAITFEYIDSVHGRKREIMNLSQFKNSTIQNLLRENDVARLSLFGSSARDEEVSSSDIDLMVRFNKRKSLLAFVRLERELSEALGKKVDLVTENSVNPHLKKIISKDVKVVFNGKE